MASNPLESTAPQNRKLDILVLIGSVFIAGLCSIIYELLIGTTSSYFLGDSIKQFSLTIGFYMAAMGIGSYLSRFIENENLIHRFVLFEIILGALGGASVLLLYIAYAFTDQYSYFSFLLTMLIGILIGLEIPLLTRIMDNYFVLKKNLSNVLSVDYVGALIATLIFPFLLLPLLGTFRSALFFGLINMCIGYMVLWRFRYLLQRSQCHFLYFLSTVIVILLIAAFWFGSTLIGLWNNAVYQDRVVYFKESPYQKIAVTKDKKDIRLYLNGNLQFSSIDEYRYHESLIHIPMAATQAKKVLLLGAGDGLAVRELLKYPELEEITLVDLDPAVVTLARSNHYIKEINQGSLESEKLHIIHQDAFQYLSHSNTLFDLIVADLPDPNNVSLARLYSKEFYQLVLQRLSPDGVMVTQATSPYYATQAFWNIEASIKAAGFPFSYPYHVQVPSFGEWGFIMATQQAVSTDDLSLRPVTLFLEEQSLENLFYFPPDIAKETIKRGGEHIEVSTLDQPNVLTAYLKGWKYWK